MVRGVWGVLVSVFCIRKGFFRCFFCFCFKNYCFCRLDWVLFSAYKLSNMNNYLEDSQVQVNLDNSLVTEQSIQCSIENFPVKKSKTRQVRGQTPQPYRKPQISIPEYFFSQKDTENYLKKHFSPVGQDKSKIKVRESWYRSANFSGFLTKKPSYKGYFCEKKNASQSTGKKKPIVEEKKVVHKKKVKSIMDYYHELVEKPKIPRRTIYNYHKEVGCNDRYRTKLQKDPKIIRDAFGHYAYSDTYLCDAKKQSRIIMFLND